MKTRSAGMPAPRNDVTDLVVKFQHGEVGLRDEEVLVIAMIADQREAFGAARQIVAVIAGHAAELAH